MSTGIFPKLSSSYILSFQFSSWYTIFANVSIKSTIIRPLSQEFRDYLDADGVFIPEGSEDVPTKSSIFDDGEGPDDISDEDETPEGQHFAFPDLDAKIRESIQEYGAVFPKLNFSSPKDASWILPASSPLKCTSPAEVYLLLKSSDFITHDTSPESAFSGCDLPETYDLELVLRKWYPIDRSRELRCFVRHNILIGISQRDTNYYDFYNEVNIRDTILASITAFWESKIRPKWEISDYTFDILLTRDLVRGHILDFNPYAPQTDALLFTYDELHDIFLERIAGDKKSATLKIIDSKTHPAAVSNMPAYQHNMMPFEALNISNGRNIEEFSNAWKEGIRESMNG
ncbi:D123-domain-containing protein [Collybia nuda]|uniref:D123-domain-containing protein n=1 Tax=Collybia nuda TaxID=64659 RepID=A0A9P6CQF1_9AGAR|nr:D123-domain-containing protein [Collybia nuda]